jgi:hypothetical protein
MNFSRALMISWFTSQVKASAPLTTDRRYSGSVQPRRRVS